MVENEKDSNSKEMEQEQQQPNKIKVTERSEIYRQQFELSMFSALSLRCVVFVCENINWK